MAAGNETTWDDPRPDFKWPISVAQPIVAEARRVWDVISIPGNLEPCHPFCARNPVEVWPGAGARDEIHYLSGWVFERQFCHWIDGVGYDLEISSAPTPGSPLVSICSWPMKMTLAGLRE